MWCSGTASRRPRAAGAEGAAARVAARRRQAAAPARRLDQPHAGVAAAQRAADLLLELVQRLHRVPARRLEARHERRRRLLAVALHGEAQGRVVVVGRRGLEDRDVGVHGGAAAVAARLAGDLHVGDARVGGWRGQRPPAPGRGARGRARRATSSSLSQSWPAGRRAAAGEGREPAPGGLRPAAAAPCTWNERWARPSWLTKVPVLSAHEAAGSTAAAAGRGGRLHVVDHDRRAAGLQEGVDLSRRRPAVEVVLDHQGDFDVALGGQPEGLGQPAVRRAA